MRIFAPALTNAKIAKNVGICLQQSSYLQRPGIVDAYLSFALHEPVQSTAEEPYRHCRTRTNPNDCRFRVRSGWFRSGAGASLPKDEWRRTRGPRPISLLFVIDLLLVLCLYGFSRRRMLGLQFIEVRPCLRDRLGEGRQLPWQFTVKFVGLARNRERRRERSVLVRTSVQFPRDYVHPEQSFANIRNGDHDNALLEQRHQFCKHVLLPPSI